VQILALLALTWTLAGGTDSARAGFRCVKSAGLEYAEGTTARLQLGVGLERGRGGNKPRKSPRPQSEGSPL